MACFASDHADWKRCGKVSAIGFLAFFRETLSRLPCVDPADHCADVHRYGCTDAGHKATSAAYMCLFFFHPHSNIDAIILRQPR